jgi:RNA polymerase sigma-70 factor (ECF subfamily)
VPDAEDYDSFYRSTRQRVLSCVYLVTGDLGDAQDAVQEAYMKAWLRWSTVGRYDEPESWVRLVACRIATSRWRSMRSRVRAHGRHGPAADLIGGPSTDTLEIVAALKQLPEEQRVALALHYLVGLAVVDVAKETGAPVGTVKSRLARGRRALAEILALDTLETPEGNHA